MPPVRRGGWAPTLIAGMATAAAVSVRKCRRVIRERVTVRISSSFHPSLSPDRRSGLRPGLNGLKTRCSSEYGGVGVPMPDDLKADRQTL